MKDLAIGAPNLRLRFHTLWLDGVYKRDAITPEWLRLHRGKGSRAASDAANPSARTPDEKHHAMIWAQRLKRVFGIDVETCVHCGGKVKIVASVEEPQAIRAILDHFRATRHAGAGATTPDHAWPPAAAA